MKTPGDNELDELLRLAARDTRPADWERSVARGLEGRVQQRLQRAPSWAEALFSMDSWRPAVVSAFIALAAAGWAARPVMDLCDDEWVTASADAAEASAADADAEGDDNMDDDPLSNIDL